MSGIEFLRPKSIPEGFGESIAEHFLYRNSGRIALLKEMTAEDPAMILSDEESQLLAQADAVDRFMGETVDA